MPIAPRILCAGPDVLVVAPGPFLAHQESMAEQLLAFATAWRMYSQPRHSPKPDRPSTLVL